ncbi:unnamed protein product, partial [Meganyctiphanes norvegica]
ERMTNKSLWILDNEDVFTVNVTLRTDKNDQSLGSFQIIEDSWFEVNVYCWDTCAIVLPGGQRVLRFTYRGNVTLTSHTTFTWSSCGTKPENEATSRNVRNTSTSLRICPEHQFQ